MSNAKAVSLVKAFTATVGLILVVGIITASAQTSQFVSMMRNARVFFADGTAAAPSITMASDTDTGFFSAGANTLDLSLAGVTRFRWQTSGLAFLRDDDSTITMGSSNDTVICRGAANVIGIGGCTSSFPAIKRSTTSVQIRLADDSAFAVMTTGTLDVNGGSYKVNNTVLISTTTPTISSGFGTSPSIVNSNGPSAFTLNVGTGGVATSGVVGLPTATTGWSCFANDRTNNNVTRQTATTTTTATFTAAAAWVASDILNISCFGY